MQGGNNVEEARQCKSEATDILGDATFSLHKWASNVSELDGDGEQKDERGEQTAPKQELGVKPTETKILGTQWDKENDTLTVQMGSRSESPTKRTVLSRLAKIYDPLGITSPLLLQGKQVYREEMGGQLIRSSHCTKTNCTLPRNGGEIGDSWVWRC